MTQMALSQGTRPLAPPSLTRGHRDWSRVVYGHYAKCRDFLERGTPLPAPLNKRLSVDWCDKENGPPRARVSGLAPYPELSPGQPAQPPSRSRATGPPQRIHSPRKSKSPCLILPLKLTIVVVFRQ
jgi:hypothetical protein